MANKFFTADWHLLHARILEYCDRPFHNVHEMNEALIENHNEIVKPGDDVYVLGDIALGNPRVVEKLISRFNGKLHLIQGNHDKTALKCKELFQWIKPFFELTIQDMAARGNKRLVVMCHYAMRVWNRSHHGMETSIHLYGHSHGGLDDTDTSASMDVGVDSAAKVLGAYRPFSYEEVINSIKKKWKKKNV
jgi:calcineurin-like phosphoesterase family protein